MISAVFLTASFSLIHNVPDWQIIGKWIGTIAAVAINGIVLSILCLFKRKPQYSAMIWVCPFCLVAVNLAVIVYCLLQFSGLVNNYTPFQAVADFDNPAGVAALICVTFPFVLIISGNNKVRPLILVALFAIDTSLLFAIQSRVGMTTITASAIILLGLQCKEKRIKPVVLVLFSLLIVTAMGGVLFLFHHKIASTNGRMVIYNTCMRMVAEHPLFGFGFGGFRREYMNWQAEYLKTIDNIDILMLSDNVTHPLSEYLLVVVNYGLTGLSVIIGMISFAIVHACRQKGRHRAFLLMEICSLCTLSLFSYPFRYPMTTVVMAYLIIPCLFHLLKKSIPLIFRKIVPLIVMFFSLGAILFLLPLYKANVQWKSFTDKLNEDARSAIVLMYEALPSTDKMLINNPRYLYTKAVLNYYADDCCQALIDARKSSNKLSSYDTELLLGSIYQKMGLDAAAESHYKEASYMCPSRITPLYKLFRLYEALGDTTDMAKTGHKLLNKPIKKASHDTRAMRLDVRRKLFISSYK